MDSIDLERLEVAIKLDNSGKRINPNEFDVISDSTILKSFNLPLTIDDVNIYEKSLVKRLLSNRIERPSNDTWNGFLNIAKAEDMTVANAAELYFYIKDKYPIRNDTQPDDAPPNITGDAPMEGFGLMGDDKDKCG